MKLLIQKNSLTNNFRLWLPVILLLLFITLNPFRLAAQDALVFPPLTGTYEVGKTEIEFTDDNRPEIFTDDQGDIRQLMTTIYYPASVSADTPSPYVENELRDAVSNMLEVDPALWSIIQTRFVSHATLAEAESAYPVILFSPGFGNLPLFYTALLEDIASHGYIVVSISRPYSDPVTVFPDGRTVLANPAGSDPSGDTFSEAQTARERIGGVWVDDIRFLLDEMAIINAEDPFFAEHLDLTRIGVLGHSFGGAAGAAASIDKRIKAVVNMDGSLFGLVALDGFSQPYLLMEEQSSEFVPEGEPSDTELAAQGLTREEYELFGLQVSQENVLDLSEAGCRLQIAGAEHNTFTSDLALFAPYFPDRISQEEVGTIDSERAVEIISRYTTAFFDQYVKGQDSPPLDSLASDDPEVELEVYS